MYKSSKQQDIGHPNEIIPTLTLPTDPTPATTTNPTPATNPSSATTINDHRTMDDNSRVHNIDINMNDSNNSNDNNNNNNKSMTTSHSISGDRNTSQLTFNDCIISTSGNSPLSLGTQQSYGQRDNFEDGAGGCSYDKVRGHCTHFNQLPNLRHSPYHSKYNTFKHPTSNISATTIPTPSNLSATQQQILYHHARAAKLKELQF